MVEPHIAPWALWASLGQELSSLSQALPQLNKGHVIRKLDIGEMWGQVFWIPFIDFICRYWLDVFFTHFGGSSHSELVLHKMCSATIDGMSLTMVSEADSNIPSSQATSISLEPFQDRYDIFFKYLPI